MAPPASLAVQNAMDILRQNSHQRNQIFHPEKLTCVPNYTTVPELVSIGLPINQYLERFLTLNSLFHPYGQSKPNPESE